MKFKKIVASVLAVLGIAVSAAGIYLALAFQDKPPMLVEQPEQAKDTAVAYLNAICNSDFSTATQLMRGNTQFGIDLESHDQVEKLFWDAYWDHVEFELVGECYATDIGVCQQISMTYLDISDISEELRQQSMSILQARVAQATDISEIYNEHNEYREELVMSVLEQAAKEILADARTSTVVFSINMCYEDGQWKVVADKDLINTLFFGCIF